MTYTKELIRTVRFSPYRKGLGPIFTLHLWDLNQRGEWNKHVLGYRLTMREKGKTIELFAGEDFHCAPSHAVDSDDAVEAIMSFLTLRPGDTDEEYFDGYTQVQHDYCSEHAEALSCEVISRFGER